MEEEIQHDPLALDFDLFRHAPDPERQELAGKGDRILALPGDFLLLPPAHDRRGVGRHGAQKDSACFTSIARIGIGTINFVTNGLTKSRRRTSWIFHDLLNRNIDRDGDIGALHIRDFHPFYILRLRLDRP